MAKISSALFSIVRVPSFFAIAWILFTGYLAFAGFELQIDSELCQSVNGRSKMDNNMGYIRHFCLDSSLVDIGRAHGFRSLVVEMSLLFSGVAALGFEFALRWWYLRKDSCNNSSRVHTQGK
jgi:hypothetical protein